MGSQRITESNLKIGFGKGRGLEESLSIFKFCGLPAFDDFSKGDIPIWNDDNKKISCIKIRQADLVWMLEKKYLDIAIGSSVWFKEEASSALRKIVKLNIKPCRLSLIGRKKTEISQIRRVCTRFQKIAEDYFNKKNLPVAIISMQGCHEVSLALGFADAIIDIIETGNTISKMQLQELEPIYQLEHEIWTRSENFEEISFKLNKMLIKNFRSGISSPLLSLG